MKEGGTPPLDRRVWISPPTCQRARTHPSGSLEPPRKAPKRCQKLHFFGKQKIGSESTFQKRTRAPEGIIFFQSGGPSFLSEPPPR